MPDPGEPHPPKPEHFKNFDEYIAALADYQQFTSDPTGAEAERGVTAIEDFLKELADDS